MDLFKRLSSSYPGLLVGLDLSGDARVGDLVPLLPRLSQLRSEGISLAVHLAEVPNHEETSAVLATNPDRIGTGDSVRVLLLNIFLFSGHGTCIHPSLGGSEDLWQQLTQVKCPVEVCLSSNVICQTVPTFQQHHAGLYIKHGLPVGKIVPSKPYLTSSFSLPVICTDDKGVFSCDLSQELQTAATAFGLSRQELYQLSLDGLSYAFCGEEERDKLRGEWQHWRKENTHLFTH